MSNQADHDAEQDAITAACESGTCDHPECRQTPCERVQHIMDATADDTDNCTRRAARVLLAIAPAYDDSDIRTGIQDALSDIMHLCDIAGWKYSDMEAAAFRNYATERHELGIAADTYLCTAIERK